MKRRRAAMIVAHSASAGMSFKKLLKPSGVVSNATIRTSYGQVERLNSIKIAFNPSGNTKDKTVELGFDLEFMSKHLLTATLFRTKTENALLSFPLPDGLPELRNEGKITNQGINVSASSNLYTTEISSFNLTISISKSIAKLTKFVGKVGYSNKGKRLYKKGEELSLLWYDVPMEYNGKTVYDANGYPAANGWLYDNQAPDFTVNIAPTYHYKNLSASILCSCQNGGKIYSYTINKGTIYGTLKETGNREELIAIDGYTYDSKTDTYTPYSANISKEDYMVGKFIRDGRSSIVDASFFKIREASVSYLFDSPNKRYFQNISVSLIGRNLLLLAKQDHFDPETAFLGEENFAIPTTRSFSLQLTATF